MAEIRTIERVGARPYKDGELRVEIADAGNGPAVAVRAWYKARSGELRPGKEGLWLGQLEDAEWVAEMIAAGYVAALALEGAAGVSRPNVCRSCGYPIHECIEPCSACGLPTRDCIAGFAGSCSEAGGVGVVRSRG